ncbi:OTU domain-containing protein 6B-like protein [Martensiomyces pterosporus]|nr:OTU domain-containing protein 6B-like protein [Martensiomyces pterosporus]
MSLCLPEVTVEELEARHRKEQKELAVKVMALKKSVPKGDKRKKKEATAEIAVLESELTEKQEAEMKQLKESDPPPTPAEGAQDDAKNKAKARQQRRAEEMKRMQEEAEKEAEDMVDVGQVETAAIDKIAAADGLHVQHIRADGHCLYSALADQMNAYHGQSLTYADLRQRAAQHMRSHRDDFIPFMAHDNGDMFSEADFEAYCDDIANTAVWGGQQEIIALSHALETPVYVYQVGSPVLQIGAEQYSAKEPVRLSYHRHAYGLGEHYNSLRKD